jgi:hypothetical protein
MRSGSHSGLHSAHAERLGNSIGTDVEEWERVGATQLLAAAIDAAVGPYRRLSVATKVLHLKRPRLVASSPVSQELAEERQPRTSESFSPLASSLHVCE